MREKAETRDADVLLHKQMNKLIRKERQDSVLGIVMIIGILGGGFWWVHSFLEDSGWISHVFTVNMYMRDNWLEGENRVCFGVQDNQTPNGQRQFTSLWCPDIAEDIAPHNISIRFWGKTYRPDSKVVDEFAGTSFQWRCARRRDGFDCYAIN